MMRSNILPLLLAGPLWLATLHGYAQQALVASAPAAAVAADEDQLARYQQLIAELQNRQNNFGDSAGLSEAYAGLASSLQKLERHEEAVKAYDQALQLLRESSGLYALEQLPLLQAQLVSSQALKSWQQVDADRHLAYTIVLKNPAATIAQRYQALRELGLWKLRVGEDGLLPNSISDARDAAELYREELEQPEIRAAYEGKALSLANLYLDLAALEFLQAKKQLALPLSSYGTGGQRTTTEMFCETLPTADGRGRQVCRNIQVPDMNYFMSLSDRKYGATWDHLNAMQDAVLEAWAVLLPEVETHNRDAALALLTEVHSLTGAFNDFVAKNAGKRTGSRIAAPTGTRISR